MTTYPEIESVVAALGGRQLLRETIRSLGELDARVARGLPVESLHRVSQRFPEGERNRVMYIVSPRTTLLRREREGVLSPEESERLERIARLATLAEHVLESPAGAQQFLTSPHPLLDGEAPIDLAATDLGARRVESVLWQLEYGLPV
jgi:putative toxin-antitoxin system antitoxin component (TIGR02293 family)